MTSPKKSLSTYMLAVLSTWAPILSFQYGKNKKGMCTAH